MNGFIVFCVLIVGLMIGALLSGPIVSGGSSVYRLANGYDEYIDDDDYRPSSYRSADRWYDRR